jgi:hypothetical protein
LKNEEAYTQAFNDLYSPSILNAIICKWMGWAGNVARIMAMREAYKNLGGRDKLGVLGVQMEG